jgi:hypothetical protein
VTGQPVRLERDGALAVLTLDAPPLNLFGRCRPSSQPTPCASRRAADRVPELASALFATDDPEGAVRTFLEHGPGHATNEGR